MGLFDNANTGLPGVSNYLTGSTQGILPPYGYSPTQAQMVDPRADSSYNPYQPSGSQGLAGARPAASRPAQPMMQQQPDVALGNTPTGQLAAGYQIGSATGNPYVGALSGAGAGLMYSYFKRKYLKNQILKTMQGRAAANTLPIAAHPLSLPGLASQLDSAKSYAGQYGDGEIGDGE